MDMNDVRFTEKLSRFLDARHSQRTKETMRTPGKISETSRRSGVRQVTIPNVVGGDAPQISKQSLRPTSVGHGIY